MLEDAQNKIENLHIRWMMGNETPLTQQDLPETLKASLQNAPSERLNVLSLALLSQWQNVLYRPALNANTTLTPYPVLPELAKPILPEAQRGLFRRILAEHSQHDSPAQLLKLLLHRGYIAHPADWLPSNSKWDEQLPDIYLPWQQWINNEFSDHSGEDVTAENWDEWYPAQRLSAIKRQRQADPRATRELISACVGQEAADKRLKIIETFAIKLSEDDADYLQSLLSDRSQKVASTAKQLLARLGIWQQEKQKGSDETPDEIARELATQFNVKKSGLLKKSVTLSPIKLKSQKQAAIRIEHLETIPITVFCDALGMDIKTFLAAWQFGASGQEGENESIITNLRNTLADEHLPDLLANLSDYIAKVPVDSYCLQILWPRLNPAQQADTLEKILTKSGSKMPFEDCAPFVQGPINSLSWDRIKSSGAWKRLVKIIKQELEDNGYMQNYYVQESCKVLGYILPQNTAKKVIETLCELGLLKADPVLDGLKLNAELNTSE